MHKLEAAWNYFRFVHSKTENTPNVVRDNRIIEFLDPSDLVARQEAQIYCKKQSRILHAAMGIASEAGEIVGAVLKDLFQYKNRAKEPLIKEVGDLIWYLVLLIDACGWDLADILVENADKLAIRHNEKFQEELTLDRLTQLRKEVSEDGDG